jgi:hypothetical protein
MSSRIEAQEKPSQHFFVQELEGVTGRTMLENNNHAAANFLTRSDLRFGATWAKSYCSC